MTLAAFIETPWKKSHPAYEDSWLNLRPAPEFATAEVLVAATYRAVGFPGHSERVVPAAGREFDKASSKRRRTDSQLRPEAWKMILHGALQSPKQPKQSSKRFLQLCPIVPDAALYSNSARLTANSWNPGQLVERMVAAGATTKAGAIATWKALFDALSVSQGDDIWARWLQGEFERRRTARVEWQASEFGASPVFTGGQLDSLHVPARMFVADLHAVIAAKDSMTRRQWVSILEAVLRVGAVAYVLWLCEVNHRFAHAILRVLEGADVPGAREFEREVLGSHDKKLVYGMPAGPIIQEVASNYLAARLLVNLALWTLDAAGLQFPPVNDADAARALLARVAAARDRLDVAALKRQSELLADTFSRDLTCKRGIGSNVVEFCRYALQQRQTAEPTLRGYDQGFGLRKKGEYRSAPWVVSLGPVALLAFTHCCLSESSGPRSVARLREHMGEYGFDIAQDDIAEHELGHELRTLGLVLDSPDAESGMLLIPPFTGRSRTGSAAHA